MVKEYSFRRRISTDEAHSLEQSFQRARLKKLPYIPCSQCSEYEAGGAKIVLHYACPVRWSSNPIVFEILYSNPQTLKIAKETVRDAKIDRWAY